MYSIGIVSSPCLFTKIADYELSGAHVRTQVGAIAEAPMPHLDAKYDVS
jgi:hypothetical protein